MKKIIAVVILVLVFFAGSAQERPAHAETIVKEAIEKARASGKKAFIIFHASWCGWCHKMDRTMSDPLLKPLFDQYFVVKHLLVSESADKKHLENPGGEALFKKYAPKNSGIPFWLIYDGEGKVLATSKMPSGENTGCPATEPEVLYFIAVLKKTTSLSARDLKTIYERFRKNENMNP